MAVVFVGKQLQKKEFSGLCKCLFDRMGFFFAYICLMFNTVLAISIWHKMDEWDKWLFVKLNSQWTNSFFDSVLPFFRNSVFWAPLYIFLAAFIAVNYGKKGLWWALLFICTVATTDLIGNNLFKEVIKRTRPCQDVEFMNHVRLLLKQCSGSYSFVSNHAANHFGMASFAFLTFRGVFKKWMYLAFLWAFFIAYAQVYVGVHYPLDVLGGAFLGTLIGSITAWIFDKKWGHFNLG
jgi:membrane-associated phospholipid phosphatase